VAHRMRRVQGRCKHSSWKWIMSKSSASRMTASLEITLLWVPGNHTQRKLVATGRQRSFHLARNALAPGQDLSGGLGVHHLVEVGSDSIALLLPE
jgi:hypothetical protein